VLGIAAYAITAARLRVAPAAATPPPAVAAPTPSPALADVARGAIGRVVTIEALRADAESLGTGWLLDDKGDFVTNAHVLAGQLGVRIRDRDGRTHFATIVGTDPGVDIALVRSADGFPGAPLALSPQTAPVLPQSVVVIASGEATGKPDITVETLTRAGAEIPVAGNPDLDPGTPQTTKIYHDMLELDGSPVFQGNSGGPVLDANGAVIGVLTLASKSGGQAYAIRITRVAAELTRWQKS
jgi:S1-C subfamily serine protease